MVPPRDAAGQPGQPAGVTAAAIASAISAGSCARVTAEASSTPSQPELHGERGVGRGADAGVEDDRHLGLGDDQLDVVRVADAEAAADR